MNPTATRQPLALSVALLCLPLAFQFAATAPVPEAVWPMLVLSLWAGLVTLCLACGLVVAALLRCRAGLRARAGRRCGRVSPGAHAVVRSTLHRLDRA